jgi:hypothetical protein
MKNSSSGALWAVAIGITAVVLVFFVSAWKWASASDVSMAVSSITGVIGTIVGAYFGIQLGSSGKEKVEEQRDRAEDRVREMKALLSPDQVQKLRSIHPQLFQML